MAIILHTLIIPGLLKLLTTMLIKLAHLLCNGRVINNKLIILIIKVNASIAGNSYPGLTTHLIHHARIITIKLLKIIINSYSLYNAKLHICVIRLWELGVICKHISV